MAIPLCDLISARWIWCPCDVCGRRPTGLEKAHFVRDKYYCEQHCPVHGMAPPLFAQEAGAK